MHIADEIEYNPHQHTINTNIANIDVDDTYDNACDFTTGMDEGDDNITKKNMAVG